MKACIYARYSTDNQNPDTIEVQVQKCGDYAAEHGLEIVDIFADEAVSGMKSSRPEMQRFLVCAKQRDFDCVLIYDQSRFSRDIVDWFTFRRTVQGNALQLISVTQPMVGGDLNDPAVFANEGINALVNQIHVLTTRQKVITKMNFLARQALHAGGRPCLGYDIEDQKYVINEYEAEIVRLIFSMYADGKSYHNIIDTLNTKGYKTKFDKPFGMNSISTLLRNERYIGNYVYNKIPPAKNGKRNSHAVNPDAIRIVGGCPAIISEDVWDIVQKRLSNNKRNAKNTAKVEYLLSGKAVCGKCGAAMSGSRSHGTYCYYGCTAKRRLKNCDKRPIEKTKLEDFVIKYIRNYLSDDENVQIAADGMMAEQDNLQSSINPIAKSVKARINEIGNRINNINKAISQGVWSASTTSMLKSLESEQQDLYIKLSEIKEESSYKRQSREDIIQALRFIGSPNTDSRDIFNFVERVVVNDDYIDIYVYPCNNSDNKREVPASPIPEKTGTSIDGARGVAPFVGVQVVGLFLKISHSI